MKTRWKVLMVAGAVVVLLGSQVIGQGAGRGQGWGPGPAHRAGGPGQGGMGMGAIPHAGGPRGLGGGVFCCPFGPAHSSVLGPLAWSLNLTDAQIKQIRGIYDQARADANSVEQAVANARIALHEAIVAGADGGPSSRGRDGPRHSDRQPGRPSRQDDCRCQGRADGRAAQRARSDPREDGDTSAQCPRVQCGYHRAIWPPVGLGRAA